MLAAAAFALLSFPSPASADPPPVSQCLTNNGMISVDYYRFVVIPAVQVRYYSSGYCEIRSSIAMQQYLEPVGVGVMWGTQHKSDGTNNISGELSTGWISSIGFQCAVGRHIVDSSAANQPAFGGYSTCNIT